MDGAPCVTYYAISETSWNPALSSVDSYIVKLQTFFLSHDTWTLYIQYVASPTNTMTSHHCL